MSELKEKIDQNQLERIFRKRLCRVCRCGDSLEKFIIACKCLGPFVFVHKQCLEKWIEETKQTKCEICRFEFQVIFHNRSFFDWIKLTANDSNYFRPFIELFIRLCNVLFISLLGIILIFCCDYLKYNVPNEPLWRFTLTIVVPIIRLSLIIYSLVWFATGIWMEFKVWQEKNQMIEVLPYVNTKTTIGPGLLNSFVRVSGLKYVNKYLKANVENFLANNKKDN